MGKENEYSVAAQKAFETVMMGAGPRIGGDELVKIFDAASRNAGWYAERENVLYRHLALCETKPLRDWFQHWHVNDYAALFRQWVCMNLERASRDRLLFALTEEDAQTMASSLNLEEPLTDEQMARVKKGVAAGLAGWVAIMDTAIMEAVKERDPVDTRATGT